MKKILFFPLFLFVSCRSEIPQTVWDGFTQGTTYHIVIRGEVKAGIRHDVDSIFRRIDESLSLYNDGSLLSRLNRNETDSLDAYLVDCLTLSQEINRKSEGLFDVTVKPLTEAYGFAGGERVENPNLDSLLVFVGHENIRMENHRLVKSDPRVQIDLNAVAQGYTVDRIARHFDGLGLKNYLIEMGGEIYGLGTRADGEKWVVGIDAPVEGNMLPGADVQTTLRLSGRGLATSGNYRKFYEDSTGRKIVHTIDPLTGLPVTRNLLSATVLAPRAAEADAWATVCMAAGLERAQEFLARNPTLDACLVYVDENGAMQEFRSSGIVLLKD